MAGCSSESAASLHSPLERMLLTELAASLHSSQSMLLLTELAMFLHNSLQKKDLLSQRVHRKPGTELGGLFLEPSLLCYLGFLRREHLGQDIHTHKQALWCQCGPMELGWCPDRSLSPRVLFTVSPSDSIHL